MIEISVSAGIKFGGTNTVGIERTFNGAQVILRRITVEHGDAILKRSDITQRQL